MKKIILLFSLCSLLIAGYSQIRPGKTGSYNKVKAIRPSMRVDDAFLGFKLPNSIVATKGTLDDPILGTTKYDFHTNAALENRLYLHPDGTIGTTFTMAHNDDPFTDRGTGYNYFNGSSWEAQPATRLENLRTGWPSYAPWGANGEIIVSHQNATSPLVILTRPQKGTGAWTQSILDPPSGASGLMWPRVVTNGVNHSCVHIITVTGPTANGGVAYQGMDPALIYNRSTDGGTTWDGWRLLEGMTATDYLGIPADDYAFAQPVGNTLCFVVGESWLDQFLMKSTDNGTTWNKIMIWTNPFPKWAGGDTTGNFFAPDGSTAITLDKNGKAHVVFGLQYPSGNEAGEKFWTINQDGLIYWNEDMGELPQEMNPDTLNAHGNYIGWVQDTMVFYSPIAEYAYYYMSMSSMASMAIDDQNRIFVAWSGITNFRDGDNFMMRHIFQRASVDGGATWSDTIIDLTSAFYYNFQECVYPHMSPTSDDKIYILFQSDTYAGVYLNGTSGAQGQQIMTNNDMTILTPLKEEIVGVDPKPVSQQPSWMISQNYPNPFSEKSLVEVKIDRPGHLSMEISSVVGQKIRMMDKGNVQSGSYQFIIERESLPSGVYFFTVKLDKESFTRKMIVE